MHHFWRLGKGQRQQEWGTWGAVQLQPCCPVVSPHLYVHCVHGPRGPHRLRQEQRVVAVAARGVNRRVTRAQDLAGQGTVAGTK